MDLINNQNKFVFKEKTKYDKGFSRFYAENLYPLIERFNAERKIALKKTAKNLLIFVVISAIFYCFFCKVKIWLILMCVLIVIYFIIFLSVFSPIFAYENKIREKIYKQIFKFVGPFEYTYWYTKDISYIKDSKLFGVSSKESVFNFIDGVYDGHRINIFNITLSKSDPIVILKPGYRRVIWIQFDGLIIHISINKPFVGKTLLLKKDGFGFSFKDHHLQKKYGFEKIKIEYPKFNKIFKAFSTDKNEADYLLTEDFMKGLVSLSNLFKRSKIEASFYNNSLLIAIQGYKNNFEPRTVFLKNTFVSDARKIINQMGLILEVIDLLKLE